MSRLIISKGFLRDDFISEILIKDCFMFHRMIMAVS